MSDKRPLILVTNDDGYSAKGIGELVKMAQRIGDVVVVAPDSAQSGKSHAITLGAIVRLKTIKDEPGLKVYSVTGTPVDCVKMAMNQILDRKPDVLLSGINHGSNSTVSAFYSGTMGASIEGAFNNIPSVGLSLCSYDDNANFDVVVKYSEPVVRRILAGNTASNLCLNINFPDIPESEFKGLKVCRQAKGIWREQYVSDTDPFGRQYYWLTGSFENFEPDSTDTDEWALHNGYASVLPMNLDSTNYSQLENTALLI